jgi:hypothetical protein
MCTCCAEKVDSMYIYSYIYSTLDYSYLVFVFGVRAIGVNAIMLCCQQVFSSADHDPEDLKGY